MIATHEVYLEIGSKRAIASALHWPGWFRSGRDEGEALAALLACAPRYAAILALRGLAFEPPTSTEEFVVVDRYESTSANDWGIPTVEPAVDAEPLAGADFDRAVALLEACWEAFDKAARAAVGKELRKGPRGGGRELEAVVRHVLEAQIGYTGGLGFKFKLKDLAAEADLDSLLALMAEQRKEVLHALTESAAGRVAPTGPRGGKRPTARSFVRRVVYHVVDHLWEIEDRQL